MPAHKKRKKNTKILILYLNKNYLKLIKENVFFNFSDRIVKLNCILQNTIRYETLIFLKIKVI